MVLSPIEMVIEKGKNDGVTKKKVRVSSKMREKKRVEERKLQKCDFCAMFRFY